MLPVVGATPATGRRLRACVGAAAVAVAPTPGVPAAAAVRAPQAGEVFFSANGAAHMRCIISTASEALTCCSFVIGSPLGSFVEDAEGVPSTPLGPLQANAGAAVGAGLDPAVLAAAAAAAAPGGAEAENPLASLAPTQLTAVQQYISKLLGNLGAAGTAAVRR